MCILVSYIMAAEYEVTCMEIEINISLAQFHNIYQSRTSHKASRGYINALYVTTLTTKKCNHHTRATNQEAYMQCFAGFLSRYYR